MPPGYVRDKKDLVIVNKMNKTAYDEPETMYTSTELGYISFRAKFLQCRIDGTLKERHCKECDRPWLECTKYGGNCNSGKCREERKKVTIDDDIRK